MFPRIKSQSGIIALFKDYGWARHGHRNRIMRVSKSMKDYLQIATVATLHTMLFEQVTWRAVTNFQEVLLVVRICADMSTRKIRLSKTLTLRFRDSPMLVQEAANGKKSQDTDHQAFESLPDLLPGIFRSSQTDGPAGLAMVYSIGNYSETDQEWESTSDLALSLGGSHHEATDLICFLNETPDSGGTDNSVRSDPTQIGSSFQFLEVEYNFTLTPPLRIENLRRVQAYPPLGCNTDIEEELEFESINPTTKHATRENQYRSAQIMDQLQAESTMEAERAAVNAKDIDNHGSHEVWMDSYLLLEDYATDLSSPSDVNIDDESGSSSRNFGSEKPQGILQLPNDKHCGVKQIRKRKSKLHDLQIDIIDPLNTDPPSKIQKQKRSNIKRRAAASVCSNQSGHMSTRWYSMNGESVTDQDNDDGRQIVASGTKKVGRRKKLIFSDPYAM